MAKRVTDFGIQRAETLPRCLFHPTSRSATTPLQLEVASVLIRLIHPLILLTVA